MVTVLISQYTNFYSVLIFSVAVCKNTYGDYAKIQDNVDFMSGITKPLQIYFVMFR